MSPFWPLAFNLCQMRRLAGSLSEQRFSYGLSTAGTVKMIHRCSSNILHFYFSFYPPLGVLPGISRQGNNFIALSLRCNADKRFFHQFHSFYHWSKRAFSILFIPRLSKKSFRPLNLQDAIQQVQTNGVFLRTIWLMFLRKSWIWFRFCQCNRRA